MNIELSSKIPVGVFVVLSINQNSVSKTLAVFTDMSLNIIATDIHFHGWSIFDFIVSITASDFPLTSHWFSWFDLKCLDLNVGFCGSFCNFDSWYTSSINESISSDIIDILDDQLRVSCFLVIFIIILSGNFWSKSLALIVAFESSSYRISTIVGFDLTWDWSLEVRTSELESIGSTIWVLDSDSCQLSDIICWSETQSLDFLNIIWMIWVEVFLLNFNTHREVLRAPAVKMFDFSVVLFAFL